MTFYRFVFIMLISAMVTYAVMCFKKKYYKRGHDRALIELIRLNQPFPGSPEELKKKLQDVPDKVLEGIIKCLVDCRADKIYKSMSDSSDRAKKIVDRALSNRE